MASYFSNYRSFGLTDVRVTEFLRYCFCCVNVFLVHLQDVINLDKKKYCNIVMGLCFNNPWVRLRNEYCREWIILSVRRTWLPGKTINYRIYRRQVVVVVVRRLRCTSTANYILVYGQNVSNRQCVMDPLQSPSRFLVYIMIIRITPVNVLILCR